MFLFPDSTGHPEISRRSGDFSAEGAEGRKVSFSMGAFSRFCPLAGGCGVWLKRLNHLNIKNALPFLVVRFLCNRLLVSSAIIHSLSFASNQRNSISTNENKR